MNLPFSTTKKNQDRYWEIDFLRGIAIIFMVAFHFIYDLNFFQIITLNQQVLPWHVYTYSVASLFLLLVGLSLSLSYSKASKNVSEKQRIQKIIIRGFFIFSLGLLITSATWIYLNGNGTIIFGVLHCIGISTIFSIPFLKKPRLTLPIGTICILLGIILAQFKFHYSWLLWLGFRPHQFYTLDYFPMLPWFGVVLVGIFIGNTLYPKGIRKKHIKDLGTIKPVQGFLFLGRHSLIIYLLHQVIIVGIISLLKTGNII